MKKPISYIILPVIVLTAVIVFVFLIINNKRHSYEINIPPITEEQTGKNENGFITADVTTDTIKAVISTILRPDGYHATYTLITYWDGGKSNTNYSIWQNGNKTLISSTKSEKTNNILIDEQEVYAWTKGYSKVFKSKISDDSIKCRNRFARLFTFEELLNIDNKKITNADYVMQNSKPCVFVEYTSDVLSYVNQLYICAETGILNTAKVFDGDKLVYEMDLNTLEIGKQSADKFIFPTT